VPIEIRELVLRAVLDPGPGAGGGDDSSAGLSERERAEIVEATTAAVLAVLRRQQER
jgi:hypothetical protein